MLKKNQLKQSLTGSVVLGMAFGLLLLIGWSHTKKKGRYKNVDMLLCNKTNDLRAGHFFLQEGVGVGD